jgi:hypothetical protein
MPTIRDTSEPKLSVELRNWLNAIAATGFTFALLLLCVALIVVVSQTKDIILQLNDDIWVEQDGGAVLLSVLSLFSFSVMCWWSARFIFQMIEMQHSGHFDSRVVHQPNRFINEHTALWLPRVYAVLPGTILLLSGLLRQQFGAAMLGLVVALLSFWVVKSRTHWSNAELLSRLKLNNIWVLSGIVLLLTLILTFFSVFHLAGTSQFLGAFSTLFFGLSSLLFGMTAGVYLVTWKFWKIPLIGGLLKPPVPIFILAVAGAAVISSLFSTDNHGVRRCVADSSAAQSVQCPQPPAFAFSSLESASKTFELQLRQRWENLPGNHIPVFFVASEGGGLRAAYWSSQVMAELEKLYPGFHQHVFAMSGVSGGSVGNMFYAAALQQTELKDLKQWQKQLGDAVGQDYLSAVTTSFLYNDLLFRFLPIQADPFQQDRAQVLEQSWERGFANTFAVTEESPGLSGNFQQLYRQSLASDPDGWLPMVLSLGTAQELGQTVITAPFPVQRKDFPAAYDFYQLAQCRQQNHLSCDIRLSTAALNAARFPYVTPAGSLNYDLATGLTKVAPDKKLHVIDGGYVDNFGAATTQQLIHSLKKAGFFAEKPQQKTLVPVVLLLTNAPDLDNSIFDLSRLEPSFVNSWSLNELVSPIQGILEVSQGSAANVANLVYYQQQSSEASILLTDQPAGVQSALVNTMLFRLPKKDASVPLGWWLSANSRDRMRCELTATTETRKNITKLIALFPDAKPVAMASGCEKG